MYVKWINARKAGVWAPVRESSLQSAIPSNRMDEMYLRRHVLFPAHTEHSMPCSVPCTYRALYVMLCSLHIPSTLCYVVPCTYQALYAMFCSLHIPSTLCHVLFPAHTEHCMPCSVPCTYRALYAMLFPAHTEHSTPCSVPCRYRAIYNSMTTNRRNVSCLNLLQGDTEQVLDSHLIMLITKIAKLLTNFCSSYVLFTRMAQVVGRFFINLQLRIKLITLTSLHVT